MLDKKMSRANVPLGYMLCEWHVALAHSRLNVGHFISKTSTCSCLID